MTTPVCAVIGVGPGNGAALARRFAREGYAVALLARSATTTEPLAHELAAAGATARVYACDAGDHASVVAALTAVERDLGPIDALVYNAGTGAFGVLEAVDASAFESALRVNATGLFVAAKHVAVGMVARGRGSIIAIGATASRRGVPRTIAFAPAKAAQRSLCEALARHLWPRGVHVALVIVDGVVDLPRTRKMMADKPDEFFIQPDDVADAAFRTTTQPRSTWSFEVEARPFGESW
jgi:short-subunit dehydrogenase|nr:SDR family NAD(P)-dependent oxidoreductase [Kofleriaceae bacterium]